MNQNRRLFVAVLPYLAVWAGLFLYKSAWAALIGFHIAIFLALLILKPELPINKLFQSSSYNWIVLSVFICLPSGIGFYYLQDFFGTTRDLQGQLKSLGLNSTSWPGFITYFALVNPFIEEYFWRGVLGSNTNSFYIGDVIYAGYHVLILLGKARPIFVLLAVVILSFVGWFWRQISKRDQGLLAAVSGHMTADFSILTSIYFMVT